MFLLVGSLTQAAAKEISGSPLPGSGVRMLASNINNVVKREKVLTDVWGENDYFMGRSMDVYIARLRKKLSEDKNVAIVNVHRMGFKLEVNGISA